MIALSIRAFALEAPDSEHYTTLLRRLSEIQRGAAEDDDVSQELWTLASWARATFPEVRIPRDHL